LIGDALDLQTCPYLYSFWFSWVILMSSQWSMMEPSWSLK
jgi:hypothetical protein